VANRALADPSSIEGQGAAMLENFFPKATTVALRRGKQVYAFLAGSPTSLFSYRNGTVSRFFGATTNTIYDLSELPIPTGMENTTPTAPVVASGYTGGEWITAQFATTGGVYLVGVNGSDAGFIFDGNTFAPWTGVTFGTSGLTLADMAYVWVYKSRLFFAQKNSMNAWYVVAPDAIAGATDVFPLSGIFSQGGSLLFGAPWSLDSSGDSGLSEQCVFVSSLGEVAVYQGTDPSEADTWSKAGLYRIGAPLGRKAWMRGGGDLAIATTVGLVPLSKAITLDITALNVATVSNKIADAWTEALVTRSAENWLCEIWPEGKMAVVAPPTSTSEPVLFVSNTETGAWARFTNWEALSLEVFQGRLFFGSSDGNVYVANIGGTDAGQPYTGTIIPLFEDLGAPGRMKIATVGRARVRANVSLLGRIDLQDDFDQNLPPAPDATRISATNAWNSGIWDVSTWNDTNLNVINQDWQSVGGTGYSISACYRLTSGTVAPLDAELVDLEILYTVAEEVS
jgi:hypothetical protein